VYRQSHTGSFPPDREEPKMTVTTWLSFECYLTCAERCAIEGFPETHRGIDPQHVAAIQLLTARIFAEKHGLDPRYRALPLPPGTVEVAYEEWRRCFMGDHETKEALVFGEVAQRPDGIEERLVILDPGKDRNRDDAGYMAMTAAEARQFAASLLAAADDIDALSVVSESMAS